MPSFDIVSKVNHAEIGNAVDGVRREIGQRYDFKGSASRIERDQTVITLHADDDMKLRQMREMLQAWVTRRKIDARALEIAEPQPAAGQSVRQTITVKEGISQDISKKIVKDIKAMKIKVQASIQGDALRISGKKRDDLQAVMAHVRAMDLGLPLQYLNFRD